MLTLTDEQAALLRDMRKPLRAAIREVLARRDALVSACEHLEAPHPDCPICYLYDRLDPACCELGIVPDELDRFLTRGPLPKKAD